ncbi:hypothetical protein LOY32_03780 [Pseudomonas donghuensis]|nr:hypothetical protein LOY32_03780 [Pseudomonas donghuensis]
MTYRCAPFKGPFFDVYRIGFNLYQPNQNNWRQRTIAGVSWNGREREAFFFNPDGLVLPIEANPWELPPLLGRHTIQREFATVVGSGMFAMKKAQRNALTATGLGEWVTYWLVDFEAGYANDLANWAAYVETDLQAERQAAEASYAAVQDLRPRTGQPVERPWNEQGLQVETPTDDLPKQILENVDARRSFLQDEYARQYAEDRRIAAWLRGEAGDPPLLALMKGAA